jgi:hypothetical protein
MTKKNTKGIRGALLGVAAALTVAGFSLVADAAVTPISAVNTVEYSQGWLLVQLASGVNYTAKITPVSGCSAYAVNTDTLKAWLSVSQSAFLSGRRLKIYYTACGGENYIQTMDIWP